jgi:Ca2+-binding RTX toxin-like protein
MSKLTRLGIRSTLAAAVGTAAIAMLAAPAAAPAAMSCTFASGLLDVTLSEANDNGGVIVAGNGQIGVLRSGIPIGCAGAAPTIANTNDIQAHNVLGATGTWFTIHGPVRFGPGASSADENGGDSEIEFHVNLNNQPGSRLMLTPVDASGEVIRLGSGGINPNALPGEAQPDADIFLDNMQNAVLVALGSAGPDRLDAQGGAGTGGALTGPARLSGGEGVDGLTGGEGADLIVAGAGSDALSGGGGDDTLIPESGDDSMDGGAGSDLADYSGAGTGVSVDLNLAGPQTTGDGNHSLTSIENLFGSGYGDVLRGDGGANALSGQDGPDMLEGRGGVDTLEGGTAADSLLVRDGGPDTASCGSDIDGVTADPPGTDSLIDCENILFPTVNGGVTPGTAGSEPLATSGSAAGPARFGLRTLVTLRLAAARVRAGGPVPIAVSNSNGFAISGRLAAESARTFVSRAGRRRIGLTTRTFRLAARGTSLVRLKLPGPLAGSLKREGKLALRLRATVGDPAGTSRIVTKTILARSRQEP